MTKKPRIRLSDLQNKDTRDAGVRCTACGCRHVPVRRTTHTATITIRERVCRHCGRRFTTREVIVPDTGVTAQQPPDEEPFARG